MTPFALRRLVLVDQRKPCFVVIEIGGFPVRFCMTALALFALRCLVDVILQMTGDTASRGPFRKERSLVA